MALRRCRCCCLLPLLLLSLLYCALPARSANVLAVLPSVWKSHYLFGRRILEQLVAQQHHNYSVTLISPHALSSEEVEQQLPKIREIRVEGLLENWLEMGLSFDVEQLREKSVMERFTRLIYAGTANVDLLLADKQVRKLLHSGERFDLLVVDLFLSDALLGLAFYYQIPTVVLSPTGANTWLNHMLGNPQSSALDPSNFLPYTERMNIWERNVNTLMGLFEKLTYNFFHMILQQAVYAKHFQPLCQLADTAVSLPHYRELTKNLSLVLLNTHPVVQYPRAYLPNMLPIAGVHLSAPEQLSLPKHLKEFIEAAPGGVVYMSLGANLRSADLLREKLNAFLDVCTHLHDMHFLLKWEFPDFVMPLPANLRIAEWWPQEAILAHPNVKVFVSTCGPMSIVEAINGLTPLLALPIYPEQEVAAKRLESQGVAVMGSFDAITYDSVLQGIRKLTRNVSYMQHMEKLRTLLNADYGTPGERALHYIELVRKSGGGDFLKSHAAHLNFIRTELVDVLAIIALGVFLIIAVPFFTICCILRKSYHGYASQAPSTYQVTLKAVDGRGSAQPRGSVSGCETINGSGGTPTNTAVSAGGAGGVGGAFNVDNVVRQRRHSSTSASNTSTPSSSPSSSGSPHSKPKRAPLERRRNTQSSQLSD